MHSDGEILMLTVFQLTLIWRIATFSTVALLIGFGTNASNQERLDMKTIEGSVWYRERMLLPENANVRVSLEDVARMDVPAEIIATIEFKPKGAPPFTFALKFDPNRIHDKGRYALRARIESNGRLLFTSTEHIPAFENGNKPVEIKVSRVGDTHVDPGGSASAPNASLTDTYWKLTELKGQPVIIGAGQREPHLILNAEGNRAHGFAGCNRFSGAYKLDKRQIEFEKMASTRMACIEGMEQEQQFFNALSKTLKFFITGETLIFFGPEGERILCFQAVHLE